MAPYKTAQSSNHIELQQAWCLLETLLFALGSVLFSFDALTVALERNRITLFPVFAKLGTIVLKFSFGSLEAEDCQCEGCI